MKFSFNKIFLASLITIVNQCNCKSISLLQDNISNYEISNNYLTNNNQEDNDNLENVDSYFITRKGKLLDCSTQEYKDYIANNHIIFNKKINNNFENNTLTSEDWKQYNNFSERKYKLYNLRKTLNNLKNQIISQQADINRYKNEINNLQDSKLLQEQTIINLNHQVSDVESYNNVKNFVLETNISELKNDNELLKTRINELEEKLKTVKNNQDASDNSNTDELMPVPNLKSLLEAANRQQDTPVDNKSEINNNISEENKNEATEKEQILFAQLKPADKPADSKQQDIPVDNKSKINSNISEDNKNEAAEKEAILCEQLKPVYKPAEIINNTQEITEAKIEFDTEILNKLYDVINNKDIKHSVDEFLIAQELVNNNKFNSITVKLDRNDFDTFTELFKTFNDRQKQNFNIIFNEMLYKNLSDEQKEQYSDHKIFALTEFLDIYNNKELSQSEPLFKNKQKELLNAYLYFHIAKETEEEKKDKENSMPRYYDQVAYTKYFNEMGKKQIAAYYLKKQRDILDNTKIKDKDEKLNLITIQNNLQKEDLENSDFKNIKEVQFEVSNSLETNTKLIEEFDKLIAHINKTYQLHKNENKDTAETVNINEVKEANSNEEKVKNNEDNSTTNLDNKSENKNDNQKADNNETNNVINKTDESQKQDTEENNKDNESTKA